MLTKTQGIAAPLEVKSSRHAALEREDCFNELLKRHHGQALSMAWRLLGAHHSQAEDVVQTAFQKAWEKLGQLEKPERMKSWFFQILVNECRNLQRRHKTRNMLRQIFVPWEPKQPVSLPGDHSIQKRIHMAMQKLSPRQREVFVLIHLEGFNHQEAADTMETSLGTVKSHLHRATQLLRKELNDIHPSPKETM